MKSCIKAGLISIAVLPVVLFGGCTGSEVISTGNASFVVEVPIINPEARFDILAQMQLSQLSIRPNEPEADRSLGPRPIGVLASAADLITIDFRETGSTDPTALVLSSGSYRIARLQFSNLLLRATRPDSWDECDEFFAWVLNTLVFTADDLGDLANFQVPGSGAGALTVGIDATAFIEAFTNTWTCTNPPNPVPVVQDVAAFKALAPTYLTISSTTLN